MTDFTRFKFFKTVREANSFIRRNEFGTLQKVGTKGYEETIQVLKGYGYPEPSTDYKAVVVWNADPIYFGWRWG